MIPESELQDLRDEQLLLMPNSAQVLRPTLIAPDIEEPTLVGVWPGRYRSGIGSFRERAAQFVGIVPFVLTMPWNADVAAGDTVYDELGRKFQVKAVGDVADSYHTATRVLLDWIG